MGPSHDPGAQTPGQEEGPPAVPPEYWYSAPEDDEIDLFKLWDILWEGKWLVMASGFLCTAIAVAYALLATPVYVAKVVMVPADEGKSVGGLSALAGQFGGLASLAGISLGAGGGQSATALEVLKSYAFTTGFIEEYDLLPVLKATPQDVNDALPTLQGAAQLFRNQLIRVSTDRVSGATTLTVSWTDPVQAADWANALVHRLNNTLREREVDEARRAIAYLEARIAETSNVDMRQTLYRLIEAQTQTVMLANVRREYVFRVVDPAFPPERRSKPQRTLIVVVGGFLGGILGLIAVFGRRVRQNYQSRKSESAA